MYEAEANSQTESSSQIPTDVLSAFGDLRGNVVARTILPWSEHCTECVWPTCYSTCDLYEPREDKKCRRFLEGMVRINYPASVNSYILKIRFKRWAKLWTPGNVRLYSIDKAARLERRDYRIGTTLYQLPVPTSLKKAVTSKRYSFKKKMAQRRTTGGGFPDSFLLECYNPQGKTIPLSLTISRLNTDSKIPFQKLIYLTPGFRRVRLPFEEISRVVDMQFPFSIEMIPNDVEDGTALYFGLMDFVRENRASVKESKKIKCVVWDLDNTLWDGVLVEDGPEKLRLKPSVAEIIKELDRRGIVNSIASKNDKEQALQVLKTFQLDEYFLYPQISWEPKSQGIKDIVRGLNIGLDSLMFVDDSSFELGQVESACPGVRLLQAQQYLVLPDLEECQVPASAEAADRRKMYQVEARRQVVAEGFGPDYLAFLKHCNILLNVRPLDADNLDRVHELTQRTNQMNFSGSRYDRRALQRIIDTPYLDTYVLECQDRFGSYGVVGFSIVDRREPRMTDLMFSCRVQSKRVEHAFVGFLIRKYVAETGKDFHATYRRTERNTPSGRVFADLGMQEIGTTGGVSLLVLQKEQTVVDDGLVHICADEVVRAVG
jgi:FkbH-like protein